MTDTVRIFEFMIRSLNKLKIFVKFWKKFIQQKMRQIIGLYKEISFSGTLLP